MEAAPQPSNVRLRVGVRGSTEDGYQLGYHFVRSAYARRSSPTRDVALVISGSMKPALAEGARPARGPAQAERSWSTLLAQVSK